MMAVFRKKPVEIEAVQFMGVLDNQPQFHDGSEEPPVWLIEALAKDRLAPGSIAAFGNHLNIVTLEGAHEASPRDWIIRGIKGEIYPCKPDIFAATYDRVPA